MTFFRSCILVALFLVFFIPGVSDAQILCRSSVGGHCVNLAAAGTIPGLEFLGEIETPSALFSKVYTFGVSFVGLAAFFMFTYGAVRYMMAGESSPSEARKIMYNALIGLVLALVSYLILNIINPDLVKGFNLALPPIPGLKASGPSSASSPGSQACGSGTCSAGYTCINTTSGSACQPQTGGSSSGDAVTTQVPCGPGVCSPGYVCGSTASGPACFPPGDIPKTTKIVISDTTFPMSQPSAPPDPKLLQACKDAGRIAERSPLAIGGTKCVTFCLAKNEAPRNPKCLD